MAETSIQWCDFTFNPWSGCTKVSPGCANCYAEVNYSVKVRGVKWGPQGNRVVKAESGWKEPLKWNREAAKCEAFMEGQGRPRVFCASLADIFEDWQGKMVASNGSLCVWCERCQEKTAGLTPEKCLCGSAMRRLTMQDVRARLFRLIDATPNLDWLLLTKRPENIGRMTVAQDLGTVTANYIERPRKNVWLGVSVEDRKHGLPRIDILRTISAAVRFLSVEPLLEDLGQIDLAGIDWVIVGGESGPKARPFDLAWARSLRDQCKAAGVPFFLKQLGSDPHAWKASHEYPSDGSVLPLTPWTINDSHGGDESEWPEDLQGCREFPR